ncbi:MAG: carbonic anhydrase [Gammaproteobacteria bacterium]|nr:MAG: carbonic anhydrase [Gammaproteobacteria bacterium]
MQLRNIFSLSSIKYDVPSGLVVFLVALPLCLGIALASGAPLFSGIIAGIVGGIVVGSLSGSPTSVSGPAAGLSAIVLSAITTLNNFEFFLMAVVIAGLIQMALGIFKAGFFADFVPSNVIKGLLAAIGIILILKQIPHAVGYDADAIGDFSFTQTNNENTFTAILAALNSIQLGAVIICVVSITLMLIWGKTPLRKLNFLPAPLFVVILGIVLNEFFKSAHPSLVVSQQHLVTLPESDSISDFFKFFTTPDFSAITHVNVWTIAITLALVASLETLLNLEATDKLDKHKRSSPPNRELFAQGIGNTVSGLIGGIPITSVIVRSSANINAGAVSKVSTIFHGLLLLVCALTIPALLNKIPLASLAAILILIGYKLASVSLFKDMYFRGIHQFLPFVVTVSAIVMTNLLLGIAIGMVFSLFFILSSNFRNPFGFIKNSDHTGEIIRLELAPQVSFFNKPYIYNTLNKIPNESQLVIDASNSDFIDYDVLESIKEFRSVVAPERDINLSLLGFNEKYDVDDDINYTRVMTKEMQEKLSPADVLEILKQGNERFSRGDMSFKDLMHQVRMTSKGQHPMAAILSCIDSRVSNELVFDVGLGDIFSVRVAGNIVNDDVLGSLEYACKYVGTKLIVVLGHSGCGAVKAACDHVQCGHITQLLEKIQPAVHAEQTCLKNRTSENKDFVKKVTEINVALSVENILHRSDTLAQMWRDEQIDIVGATYSVKTGRVTFIDKAAILKRIAERVLFA